MNTFITIPHTSGSAPCSPRRRTFPSHHSQIPTCLFVLLKSALFSWFSAPPLHPSIHPSTCKWHAGGQLWDWNEWKGAVARREPLWHEQSGRLIKIRNKDDQVSWIEWMDIWRGTLVSLPFFFHFLASIQSPNILYYLLQLALGCPFTLSKHLSVVQN